MIVALNQKGGVGKTTLALHLAGEWARRGSASFSSTPIPKAPRSTGRSSEGTKAWRACLVSSVWREIRFIAKRPSWREAPITW